MAKLSISRAWDQTREVLRRDGRLITNVALALLVLPATFVGMLAPSAILTGEQPPSWGMPLNIAAALIGIAGQIAITRLALGPTTTVRDAIEHGFRRLIPVFLAALLLALAFSVLAVPLLIVFAGAEGLQSATSGAPSGRAVGAFVLIGFVLLLLGARFQLITPVGAGEGGGPVVLLKRSWELTKGHYWRFLALAFLWLIVLIIVVLYIGQIAIGLLVKTMFGDVSALSVGALLAALIAAVIQAIFSTVLAVMYARIYAQVAAVKSGASVPNSGT